MHLLIVSLLVVIGFIVALVDSQMNSFQSVMEKRYPGEDWSPEAFKEEEEEDANDLY